MQQDNRQRFQSPRRNKYLNRSNTFLKRGENKSKFQRYSNGSEYVKGNTFNKFENNDYYSRRNKFPKSENPRWQNKNSRMNGHVKEESTHLGKNYDDDVNKCKLRSDSIDIEDHKDFESEKINGHCSFKKTGNLQLRNEKSVCNYAQETIRRGQRYRNSKHNFNSSRPNYRRENFNFKNKASNECRFRNNSNLTLIPKTQVSCKTENITKDLKFENTDKVSTLSCNSAIATDFTEENNTSQTCKSTIGLINTEEKEVSLSNSENNKSSEIFDCNVTDMTFSSEDDVEPQLVALDCPIESDKIMNDNTLKCYLNIASDDIDKVQEDLEGYMILDSIDDSETDNEHDSSVISFPLNKKSDSKNYSEMDKINKDSPNTLNSIYVKCSEEENLNNEKTQEKVESKQISINEVEVLSSEEAKAAATEDKPDSNNECKTSILKETYLMTEGNKGTTQKNPVHSRSSDSEAHSFLGDSQSQMSAIPKQDMLSHVNEQSSLSVIRDNKEQEKCSQGETIIKCPAVEENDKDTSHCNTSKKIDFVDKQNNEMQFEKLFQLNASVEELNSHNTENKKLEYSAKSSVKDRGTDDIQNNEMNFDKLSELKSSVNQCDKVRLNDTQNIEMEYENQSMLNPSIKENVVPGTMQESKFLSEEKYHLNSSVNENVEKNKMMFEGMFELNSLVKEDAYSEDTQNNNIQLDSLSQLNSLMKDASSDDKQNNDMDCKENTELNSLMKDGYLCETQHIVVESKEVSQLNFSEKDDSPHDKEQSELNSLVKSRCLDGTQHGVVESKEPSQLNSSDKDDSSHESMVDKEQSELNSLVKSRCLDGTQHGVVESKEPSQLNSSDKDDSSHESMVDKEQSELNSLVKSRCLDGTQHGVVESKEPSQLNSSDKDDSSHESMVDKEQSELSSLVKSRCLDGTQHGVVESKEPSQLNSSDKDDSSHESMVDKEQSELNSLVKSRCSDGTQHGVVESKEVSQLNSSEKENCSHDSIADEEQSVLNSLVQDGCSDGTHHSVVESKKVSQLNFSEKGECFNDTQHNAVVCKEQSILNSSATDECSNNLDEVECKEQSELNSLVKDGYSEVTMHNEIECNEKSPLPSSLKNRYSDNIQTSSVIVDTCSGNTNFFMKDNESFTHGDESSYIPNSNTELSNKKDQLNKDNKQDSTDIENNVLLCNLTKTRFENSDTFHYNPKCVKDSMNKEFLETGILENNANYKNVNAEITINNVEKQEIGSTSNEDSIARAVKESIAGIVDCSAKFVTQTAEVQDMMVKDKKISIVENSGDVSNITTGVITSGNMGNSEFFKDKENTPTELSTFTDDNIKNNEQKDNALEAAEVVSVTYDKNTENNINIKSGIDCTLLVTNDVVLDGKCEDELKSDNIENSLSSERVKNKDGVINDKKRKDLRLSISHNTPVKSHFRKDAIHITSPEARNSNLPEYYYVLPSFSLSKKDYVHSEQKSNARKTETMSEVGDKKLTKHAETSKNHSNSDQKVMEKSRERLSKKRVMKEDTAKTSVSSISDIPEVKKAKLTPTEKEDKTAESLVRKSKAISATESSSKLKGEISKKELIQMKDNSGKIIHSNGSKENKEISKDTAIKKVLKVEEREKHKKDAINIKSTTKQKKITDYKPQSLLSKTITNQKNTTEVSRNNQKTVIDKNVKNNLEIKKVDDFSHLKGKIGNCLTVNGSEQNLLLRDGCKEIPDPMKMESSESVKTNLGQLKETMPDTKEKKGSSVSDSVEIKNTLKTGSVAKKSVELVKTVCDNSIPDSMNGKVTLQSTPHTSCDSDVSVKLRTPTPMSPKPIEVSTICIKMEVSEDKNVLEKNQNVSHTVNENTLTSSAATEQNCPKSPEANNSSATLSYKLAPRINVQKLDVLNMTANLGNNMNNETKKKLPEGQILDNSLEVSENLQNKCESTSTLSRLNQLPSVICHALGKKMSDKSSFPSTEKSYESTFRSVSSLISNISETVDAVKNNEVNNTEMSVYNNSSLNETSDFISHTLQDESPAVLNKDKDTSAIQNNTVSLISVSLPSSVITTSLPASDKVNSINQEPVSLPQTVKLPSSIIVTSLSAVNSKTLVPDTQNNIVSAANLLSEIKNNVNNNLLQNHISSVPTTYGQTLINSGTLPDIAHCNLSSTTRNCDSTLVNGLIDNTCNDMPVTVKTEKVDMPVSSDQVFNKSSLSKSDDTILSQISTNTNTLSMSSDSDIPNEINNIADVANKTAENIQSGKSDEPCKNMPRIRVRDMKSLIYSANVENEKKSPEPSIMNSQQNILSTEPVTCSNVSVSPSKTSGILDSMQQPAETNPPPAAPFAINSTSSVPVSLSPTFVSMPINSTTELLSHDSQKLLTEFIELLFTVLEDFARYSIRVKQAKDISSELLKRCELNNAQTELENCNYIKLERVLVLLRHFGCNILDYILKEINAQRKTSFTLEHIKCCIKYMLTTSFNNLMDHRKSLIRNCSTKEQRDRVDTNINGFIAQRNLVLQMFSSWQGSNIGTAEKTPCEDNYGNSYMQQPHKLQNKSSTAGSCSVDHQDPSCQECANRQISHPNFPVNPNIQQINQLTQDSRSSEQYYPTESYINSSFPKNNLLPEPASGNWQNYVQNAAIGNQSRSMHPEEYRPIQPTAGNSLLQGYDNLNQRNTSSAGQTALSVTNEASPHCAVKDKNYLPPAQPSTTMSSQWLSQYSSGSAYTSQPSYPSAMSNSVSYPSTQLPMSYVSTRPQITYASTQPQMYVSTQPQMSYVSTQPHMSYASTQPQMSYASTQPQMSYASAQPQMSYVPTQPQISYMSTQPQTSYASTQPRMYASTQPKMSYTSSQPLISCVPTQPQMSYVSTQPAISYASSQPPVSYLPEPKTPVYSSPAQGSVTSVSSFLPQNPAGTSNNYIRSNQQFSATPETFSKFQGYINNPISAKYTDSTNSNVMYQPDSNNIPLQQSTTSNPQSAVNSGNTQIPNWNAASQNYATRKPDYSSLSNINIHDPKYQELVKAYSMLFNKKAQKRRHSDFQSSSQDITPQVASKLRKPSLPDSGAEILTTPTKASPTPTHHRAHNLDISAPDQHKTGLTTYENSYKNLQNSDKASVKSYSPIQNSDTPKNTELKQLLEKQISLDQQKNMNREKNRNFVVSHQQSPAILQQQSIAISRQQSPAISRQQSPAILQQQSAISRQQSPAILQQQSTISRQQSPVSRQQSPLQQSSVRQQQPSGNVIIVPQQQSSSNMLDKRATNVITSSQVSPNTARDKQIIKNILEKNDISLHKIPLTETKEKCISNSVTSHQTSPNASRAKITDSVTVRQILPNARQKYSATANAVNQVSPNTVQEKHSTNITANQFSPRSTQEKLLTNAPGSHLPSAGTSQNKSTKNAVISHQTTPTRTRERFTGNSLSMEKRNSTIVNSNSVTLSLERLTAQSHVEKTTSTAQRLSRRSSQSHTETSSSSHQNHTEDDDDVILVGEYIAPPRTVSRDSGYTTPSPRVSTSSREQEEEKPVEKPVVLERPDRPPVRICLVCPNIASVTCSACRSVFYCSNPCQNKHWVEAHINECSGEYVTEET